MRLSVILTTYQSPVALAQALLGYAAQSHRDFEIVVADDGSGPETAACIQRLSADRGLEIRHVWHEDRGFRKTEILNRAIVAARTDYLVFSDGDCIPRADFLEAHIRFAERGRFLSGGRVPIDAAVAATITDDEIRGGAVFDPAWLKARGMSSASAWLKLVATGTGAELANLFTTTKPTFNGHNASVWKADALAVNGFDERMGYGGLDREFGTRLENYGLRPKQIRFDAICLHLDHPRSYRRADTLRQNRLIRDHSEKARVARTPYGIEWPDPDAAPRPIVESHAGD